MNRNYWNIVYGVDVRVRFKEERKDKNLFEKPLLHRQINGDEIYIPLDVKRLWGK